MRLVAPPPPHNSTLGDATFKCRHRGVLYSLLYSTVCVYIEKLGHFQTADR